MPQVPQCHKKCGTSKGLISGGVVRGCVGVVDGIGGVGTDGCFWISKLAWITLGRMIDIMKIYIYYMYK